GVPLISGDLVGVLHVGRLQTRRFNDRDVELLQIVAERIAGAIQARQLAIERAATRLLEHSLLPTKLPHCPGLTFATRYVAAAAPYDTITLAGAGHPPPVIGAPARPAWLADINTSPPIGTTFTARPRSATTIALPHDAVVAFYTDGLIERRDESIDVGLERLRNAMSLGTPDRVAREIMRTVIGNHIPADDIALGARHRTGEPS